MEFRDLKRQYIRIQNEIDEGIRNVIQSSNFIQGYQVSQLENELKQYVGVEHCITCANGTDALQLALMAWNIGEGDAVFVPDFTFFSSGEVVSAVGATPIFVDVDKDTFNMDVVSLEQMVQKVLEQKELTPKVVICVDLFGQTADYEAIRKITNRYNLLILEDAAQGFGGSIEEKRACSFGDISTTSFFPAKPLGCYGDGGAVFTDNSEWADLIRSFKVHGKGSSKYDNIRIGMNSRLDTIQAAVLLAKLPVFINEELEAEQKVAEMYTQQLKGIVKTPVIKEGYRSSWAQYTIQLENFQEREGMQQHLKSMEIPSAVYYQKPMHRQKAFSDRIYDDTDYLVTNRLSETVLSLPFHPYITEEEIEMVVRAIERYRR